MIVIVSDEAKHAEWKRKLDEQCAAQRDTDTILAVLIATDIAAIIKEQN